MVAAAPWSIITLQHSLRFRDDRPELIWPLFSIFALLNIIFLFAYLLLEKPEAQDPDSEVEDKSNKWLYTGGLVLLVLLFIPYFVYQVRGLQRLVWFDPIFPMHGDMLLLVESGLRAFWDKGEFPHQYYQVGHWISWLTYPEGFWLPFSVPYLLGVDIRIWQYFGLAGSILLLLLNGAWVYLNSRKSWNLLLLIVPVMIPFFIFHSWAFQEYFSAMHVAGFWFFLVAWGFAHLHGFRKTGALFFGLALISRPFMIFVGPVYTIYLFMQHSRPIKERILEFTILSLPFILLMLPFILIDFDASLPGMVRAYGELVDLLIIGDPKLRYGFGFSQVLHTMGIESWSMKIALLLQLALYGLAWVKLRTDRQLLLYSAASMFLFLHFSTIPYFYTFVSPLFLLALIPPVTGEGQVYARYRRPFFVCSMGLCLAMYIFLLSWTAFRIPRHLHYHARGWTQEIFQSRNSLYNFELIGWDINDGTYVSNMIGKHHYVALPVDDRSWNLLKIELSTLEQAAPITFELAVNNEALGLLKFDPQQESQVRFVKIPTGLLYYGINRVRLSRKSDSETLIGLKQIKFEKAEPGKIPL